MRLFPRTVRSQLLLWLAGLSALSLLLVGAAVGRLATAQVAESSQQTLQAAAHAAGSLLEVQLHERAQEIELLSQAPHMVAGSLGSDAVGGSLDRRVSSTYQGYVWIGVTDADGVVQRASGGLLVGQSVAQRPWFQAARERPYLGDVHEAKLLAKLLPPEPDQAPKRFIDFASPIRDAQGALRGVVGAHVHWRWVTELVDNVLRGQSLPPQAQWLVLNARGEVLYPEALVGQPGLLRLGDDAAETLGTLRWGDGQTYLTADVPVRTALGWRIAVRLPQAVALAPVAALHQQLLLWGAGAVLVVALVALLLAHGLSRPIADLARAADDIAVSGELPAELRVSRIAEVARLRDAMVGMASTLLGKERDLARLNASLEAQVAERTQALTEANAALAQLATRDGLTGVFNRRHLDERLHECHDRWRRSQHGYAVVVVDADHFKRINDTQGHAAGDAVLRQLAGLLQQGRRSTDVVARFGGEEFVVLLPDAESPDEAGQVAERLRASVAQADFGLGHPVTISLGVAHSEPGDLDASAVMARADAALYAAKQAGRNRVARG